MGRVRVVVVALVLAACGDSGSPTVVAEDATTTTAAPPAEAPAIGFAGFGAVRAGMTLREAQEASGVAVTPTELETFGGFCFHGELEGLEGVVLLMVLSPTDDAPVTDSLDGIVEAVTVFDGLARPAGTDRGIGLGATEAEVRAAYADVTIEESPHHYDEGGHYLDARDPADPERLVRFETDGQVVTAIHGGNERAATLVEGCA